MLPIRKKLCPIMHGIFIRFIKLFSPSFTFNNKQHGSFFIRNANIGTPAFSVVAKMPFLLKLNMIRPVSLFQKSVYAFKYDEVLWCIKSIIPFSPANFRRIYELFRTEINRHGNICTVCWEFLLINLSLSRKAERTQHCF